jgi:hypothetical protein
MLGGVILVPTNFSSYLVIFIKIAVLGYKHFMLKNRNISINMGIEALVAG